MLMKEKAQVSKSNDNRIDNIGERGSKEQPQAEQNESLHLQRSFIRGNFN
jgi:hypothetical protein